jgi:c-di-GMP-binding flagellar brake protein YcgR
MYKCDNLPVFMAESVDISGGGIAFYTRRPIKKGDYLYLNFQQLSEEHSAPVLCQTVHVGRSEELKCYIVRAKYHSITETTQDTIMRFIYQMQRKAARKLKFAPKR